MVLVFPLMTLTYFFLDKVLKNGANETCRRQTAFKMFEMVLPTNCLCLTILWSWVKTDQYLVHA